METFTKRTCFPLPVHELFAWHLRPGAFARLNPPFDPATIVRHSGSLSEGDRAELQVKIGPFKKTWIAEHSEFIPDRQFRDIQVKGPFAHWDHRHLFEPADNDSSFLEDRIEYAVPLGPIGKLFAGGSVRDKLERVFAYRHRILMQDATLIKQVLHQPRKRILVTGSHGLVGSALVPFLTTAGHTVVRLVRKATGDPNEILWDPATGKLDVALLSGFDAVIHLAGENIAGGRWTAERKRRIRESRVQGTKLLCERLAQVDAPPKVLISASAVGYYGDRGEETVDEKSTPGTGFLAEVCRAWEDATAAAKNMRVVKLRFGIVLSPMGGALAKMLTPFRMGAGGVLGSGKQYMSWIALDDLLGVVHHALHHDEVEGPVNAVVPQPVTNAEFTRTLGKVLHRPTILPLPAFAARLAFGEMAQELLLASNRVEPKLLLTTGYRYFYPDLGQALNHLLGTTASVEA